MKKGFTLVELSIVLIIIGLVIGGILVAQSMISSAKIQNLIGSIQKYEIAVSNFTLNYKFYPGDDSAFQPPGNQSGGTDGVWSCNGLYHTAEWMQVLAHLSQTGMVDKTYRPWSPIMYGGPDSNSNGDQALDGVTWPYTALSGVTASANGGPKSAIYGQKNTASGNFFFTYNLNPKDALSATTKLGAPPTTSLDTQVGVVSGLCGTRFLVPVSCADPTAVSGGLIDYISPM